MIKDIALNKRAKFEYQFLEIFEAGLVLMGSEIKSIREKKCQITESFAGPMNENNHIALYLFNAHIAEYTYAKHFGHESKRPRKLLLHKKQMNKILGNIKKKGLSFIPIKLYFNEKNRVKLEIALAKGKNVQDKRETIKQRDWSREKSRVLKGYNT